MVLYRWLFVFIVGISKRSLKRVESLGEIRAQESADSPSPRNIGSWRLLGLITSFIPTPGNINCARRNPMDEDSGPNPSVSTTSISRPLSQQEWFWVSASDVTFSGGSQVASWDWGPLFRNHCATFCRGNPTYKTSHPKVSGAPSRCPGALVLSTTRE